MKVKYNGFYDVKIMLPLTSYDLKAGDIIDVPEDIKLGNEFEIVSDKKETKKKKSEVE